MLLRHLLEQHYGLILSYTQFGNGGVIQKHIDADTTPCDAMNFTVGKYDLVRTDCHGFNVKEQSQYIGSIDILRAPEGY